MDFALSEAQAEIRRQVAALARGFGWDYWREKDRKAEYPIRVRAEPSPTRGGWAWPSRRRTGARAWA